MKPLKHKHLTFLSFLLALLLIFSALPFQVGADDLIPADPGISGNPDEPNGPVLPDDPGDSPISVTEGIYRFGTPLHNLYLNTPNKVSLSGQRLIQWNNEDGVLSRFKICSLGNNTYCIRSMANNQLALTASGTNVILSDIGSANSSSVPTTARWQFFYGTWGKYIKNVSTGTVITSPSTSDYGEDQYITLSNYTGLQRHGWYPTLVSSDTAGVEIYHKTSQVIAEKSFHFAAGTYSSTVGSNPVPSITWSVTNVTGWAVIDSSTGDFFGVGAGSIIVTASTNVLGQTYSNSINVQVSLSSDFCEIFNIAYSFNSLQVDNDSAPNYNGDGDIIEQFQSICSTPQRWVFTYLGDDYYKITSAISGLAITVPPNKIYDVDSNLILCPYIGTSNQKWKFIWDIDQLCYKIKAMSSYGCIDKDLVMTLETDFSFLYINGEGLNLQQKDFNESSRDFWRIRTYSYSDLFLEGQTPSLEFSLQCVGEAANNPTWKALIQSAIFEWNTLAGANIVLSESSNYKIEFLDHIDDLVGYLGDKVYSNENLISSTIYLDLAELSTKTNAFRKSVIVHEIGHMLGLKDNPPLLSDNASIMIHERNREIIFFPAAM